MRVKVIQNGPLIIGDDKYQPGQVFELDTATAKRLLDTGGVVVRTVGEQPKKPPSNEESRNVESGLHAEIYKDQENTGLLGTDRECVAVYDAEGKILDFVSNLSAKKVEKILKGHGIDPKSAIRNEGPPTKELLDFLTEG